VKIEIAKRTNVLRIPNAALRFRPTNEIFAALKQTPPAEANIFAGGGRGGRGAAGPGGQGAAGPGANQSAPSATVPRAPAGAVATANPQAGATPGRGEGRGRMGGGGGGRGGFGGGDPSDPEFQARMLERFKTMPPDQQEAFLARMKERGGDTSRFVAAQQPARKAGAASNTVQAQTIDALFPPLPVVESRGRAWLHIDNQLKPVALRLGISDGTYTEVISDELQETSEVVTGVTGLTPARGTPTQGGSGNPLMPGRGPGGGGRGGRG
jgi:HlyD family secretion protein